MTAAQNNTVTMYASAGDNVRISRINPDNIAYNLQPGTYVVCYNPDDGFFLSRKPGKPLTGKLYGNVEARADKIVATYFDRPGRNTGVLLDGLRGTGKTVLARLVCEKMIAAGGVVILVQADYAGNAFNQFITAIKQPALVLVDEFEKVYNKTEEQQQLLTLMDGMEADNKLWVLTVNNKPTEQALFNRPSRIFYHFTYGALEPQVIAEICADKGMPPEAITQMASIHNFLLEPTYDVVMSLIEETKRQKCLPLDVISEMNILAVDPKAGFRGGRIIVRQGDITLFAFRESSWIEPAKQHYWSFDRSDVNRMLEDYLKLVNMRFDNIAKPITLDKLNEKFYDNNQYDLKFSHVDANGLFILDFVGLDNVQLVIEREKEQSWSPF